jgi:hypothetical protein
MNIQFLNEKYKERYHKLLMKDKATEWDSERKAMFYIFASQVRLFESIKDLYDFKERSIVSY